MWRNWNPHTPLVGKYSGAATAEKSGVSGTEQLAYNPAVPFLNAHEK